MSNKQNFIVNTGKKSMRILILFAIFLSQIQTQNAASGTEISWQSKVDQSVLESAAKGEIEFIVYMREQADLSAASQLTTKLEKGAYVHQQLVHTAQRAQGEILQELSARGIPHRSYWIANMIWVRGKAEIVEAMARRPNVAQIYANPKISLDQPVAAPPADIDLTQTLTPTTIEWNIIKVRAPEVWAAGFRGQGVVVAGADTGYDWTHPALKNQYRGWDGLSANHNYNWHDAIHENDPLTVPGNICGFDSPTPCDDHSHGTHTMGTIVGDDGGSNQIGMAPGAKWIGCRNMEEGRGTPITYSECFQWFIAPWAYGADSTTGDPSKAPDVINNSWACPTSEGCSWDTLQTVVENVRAAGILTVQSAGNSGPSCGTVNTPAAIYDASFTVGNTTTSDLIASTSSRGPVTIDGSNRLKPDVSAPGTGIRSSVLNASYAYLSGTSMASPHVAGLTALLISARPSLAGQVDQIEDIIRFSALPRTTDQTCGGIPGYQVPNNTYGWGRIDAWQAVIQIPHMFTLQKTVSEYQIEPGDLLTYTFSISHQHPVSLAYDVVVSDALPVPSEFITATPPYNLDFLSLSWELGDLGLEEQRQLTLVVQVPIDYVGPLSNWDYLMRSNNLPSVSGPSLTTWVGKSFFFFPFIQIGP